MTGTGGEWIMAALEQLPKPRYKAWLDLAFTVVIQHFKGDREKAMEFLGLDTKKSLKGGKKS